MRELTMDVSEWQSLDDLYLSFFQAVGAPEWHGRNFDAIRDSIAGREINQIETPYRLVLKNYDVLDPAVKVGCDDFVDLIRELAVEEGIAIDIRVEN